MLTVVAAVNGRDPKVSEQFANIGMLSAVGDKGGNLLPFYLRSYFFILLYNQMELVSK